MIHSNSRPWGERDDERRLRAPRYPPLALLVGVTLGYGFVLSMDSALTSTLVTEVAADDHVGTALSIQSLVDVTTTVVSPVVFGFALDRAGYAATFPTLAAGALLGVLSVGVLTRIRSVDVNTRADYPSRAE